MGKKTTICIWSFLHGSITELENVDWMWILKTRVVALKGRVFDNDERRFPEQPVYKWCTLIAVIADEFVITLGIFCRWSHVTSPLWKLVLTLALRSWVTLSSVRSCIFVEAPEMNKLRGLWREDSVKKVLLREFFRQCCSECLVFCLFLSFSCLVSHSFLNFLFNSVTAILFSDFTRGSYGKGLYFSMQACQAAAFSAVMRML